MTVKQIKKNKQLKNALLDTIWNDSYIRIYFRVLENKRECVICKEQKKELYEIGIYEEYTSVCLSNTYVCLNCGDRL